MKLLQKTKDLNTAYIKQHKKVGLKELSVPCKEIVEISGESNKEKYSPLQEEV